MSYSRQQSQITKLYELPHLKLRTKDDFRLLHFLENPSDQDSIHCELLVDDQRKWKDCYFALSYVWGQELAQNQIVLNDIPFLVQPNLYNFFMTYRDDLRDTWLWVDALCIDQGSVEERNHQVRLMKRIYEDALYVLAWLGTETECFKQLSQNLVERYVNPYSGTEFPWYNPELEEQYAPEQFAIISRGMAELVENEYWTRMWIIQEFVLAKDLYLLKGPYSIHWSKIDVNRKMELPIDGGYRRFLEIFHARNWRFSFWDKSMTYFESLFHHHNSGLCREIQDKVYALLGICSGQDANIFTDDIVDYQQDGWELLRKLLSSCHLEHVVSFIHVFVQVMDLMKDLDHPQSHPLLSRIGLNEMVTLRLKRTTVHPNVCIRGTEQCVGSALTKAGLVERNITGSDDPKQKSNGFPVYLLPGRKHRNRDGDEIWMFSLDKRMVVDKIISSSFVISAEANTSGSIKDIRMLGVEFRGINFLEEPSDSPAWSILCEALLEFDRTCKAYPRPELSNDRSRPDASERGFEWIFECGYVPFLKLVRFLGLFMSEIETIKSARVSF